VAHSQSDDWDPPNPDTDSRTLVVASHTYNLEILGPSVQEPYSAMRHAYMAISDGFLLIYSVADRNSFEDILSFYQQILRIKDKEWFPMIVVGNDSDSGRAREVTAEEGRALANRMGCSFLEANAVTGYNVETAFGNLTREVSKYRMGF
jgi:GTPase KRas